MLFDRSSRIEEQRKRIAFLGIENEDEALRNGLGAFHILFDLLEL